MAYYQYSAMPSPMHKHQEGDYQAVLHQRTCSHHSFCNMGQERLGFPQWPQLRWTSLLCEFSLVAISWTPAQCTVAKAEEFCTLATASDFAESGNELSSSRTDHNETPPLQLNIILCASATRGNTHHSLCPCLLCEGTVFKQLGGWTT